MNEFLEMLASLEISDLLLCALAVVVLDLFALSVILAANREAKLCRKHWRKISAEMELQLGEMHHPLEADEILLGRHLSADIRFPDPSVSRYHAVLTVTNGIWTITDLESASGTYINGKRVRQARLKDGDTIQLGNNAARFGHIRPNAPRPSGKEKRHV